MWYVREGGIVRVWGFYICGENGVGKRCEGVGCVLSEKKMRLE